MLKMVLKNKETNEEKVVRSKNLNYIRREYRKFFYTGDELNSRCFEYDVKFYINDDEYDSFADFAYTVKEEK